jgi:hypothetical protein
MKDWITYQLKSPQGQILDVHVPWAVLGSGAVIGFFESRESYYRAFCMTRGRVSKRAASTADNLHKHQHLKSKSKSKLLQQQPKTKSDNYNEASAISPKSSSEKFTHYRSNSRFISSSSSFTNSKINDNATSTTAKYSAKFKDDDFDTQLSTPTLPSSDSTKPHQPTQLHWNQLKTDSKGNIISSTLTDITTPIIADANGAFFMLDNTTGVWIMSTWSPKDETDEGQYWWYQSMASGLTKLEEIGATKLIIDVTNNGGGMICAYQAMIQVWC